MKAFAIASSIHIGSKIVTSLTMDYSSTGRRRDGF